MPGPPVSIGCSVLLSPGMAGAPDSGTITILTVASPLVSGQPVATVGATCTMINSVTGVPYTLPIGSAAQSQVKADGQALVRMGDQIPSGPGTLTILGPPAGAHVIDSTG